MPHVAKYDVCIFDCDGVILNSNLLKIDAMETVLNDLLFDDNLIAECLVYFKSNFGKSRFHHVNHFIDNILDIDDSKKKLTVENILARFSKECRSLYLTADLCPGFLLFIESLQCDKYVASGSEQNELRKVFDNRNLSQYFLGIYGSPVSKIKNIEIILTNYSNEKVVMIGDAVSDFEAAKLNKIDFIFYSPFSNVREKMLGLSAIHGFPVLESFY